MISIAQEHKDLSVNIKIFFVIWNEIYREVEHYLYFIGITNKPCLNGWETPH